jgi:Uma2 family endonuclease
MSHSAAKSKTLIKKKALAAPKAQSPKQVRKAKAQKEAWELELPAGALQGLREAEAKLVIQDDEPVDNIFSEKQQRLLTHTLYSSWTPPPDPKHPKKKRAFWVAANVGLFGSVHKSGIAPDVFVSLDVELPQDGLRKSYFYWEYEKWPEVVIEIVSDTRGGEISRKNNRYAQMGIRYYVVLDPWRHLKGEVLRVLILRDGVYQPQKEHFFPCLGLGLKLWQGRFENWENTWLRWCDSAGKLLPTADERAEREAEHAKREAQRAKHEAKRAEQATQRAKREAGRAAKLAAKLRKLGIDPEQL